MKRTYRFTKKVHKLFVEKDLKLWMAGFFDGEGYLGSYQDKGKQYRMLQLQIVNTEKSLLEPFRIFGGNIYKHSNSGKPNHLPSWSYTLRGRPIILRFILTLLPYVKGKKKQKMIAVLCENRTFLTLGDQRRFLHLSRGCFDSSGGVVV